MDSPVIASTLGIHGAAGELRRMNDGCFFWTGWRRKQWPVDAVAPGTRIYVIDLRRREFAWIARIDRVAAFDYRNWPQYERGVHRGTGWWPDRSDRDVPRPQASQPAFIGFAVRATLIRRVRISLPVSKVPRLGWLDLSNGALKYRHEDLVPYAEGNPVLRTHLERERKSSLRAAALGYWTSRHQRLRCEACGFDFERTYGARGAGFIEFHHIEPLSGKNGKRKRTARDLVPLCANCHRIIHRQSPILDLAALRRLLRGTRRRARPAPRARS
jgi:hypothetical protein